MKKEDFIVGKWYVSSKWDFFRAAKFNGFTKEGFFERSEFIRIRNNSYSKGTDRTTTDNKEWETFKEVPISEIAQYLPKDHPDLKNIIPQYIKLAVNGWDNNLLGTIFNTTKPFICYEHWDKKWTWEYLLNSHMHKKYFIPSTKEEYDAQFELQKFPEKGWCRNNSRKLYEFLKNKYPDCNINIRQGIIGFAWNKNSYYDISVGSGNPEYTIEQLNKFINNNSQQNEQESNIISTTSSENRRTIITGTVTIRCGRQQVSIGSRPKGNTTSANCGTTHIRTAQISKSVIIKKNY